MSNLDFSINMNFQPSVDPQRLAATLNVILKEMKIKLGSFGKSIELIDGDGIAKEIAKVEAKFKTIAQDTAKVNKESQSLTNTLKGTTSQAGLLGKAFQFNQVTQSISTLTNAIAPFINEFIEFDKQIKNIGTLGFKDFEKFNASLSALAAEIPGTAADMANATYQAISAGVQGSVEEVTNFVRVAAKAGVAGMSDTATAVDGLTSVINAYGLKVSDVDAVASTFFAGIKLGKTTFNEMVGSIASFVPSASALGVGFDQATAAIARYTAMGTPTAQVGTQMNAVFTLLAKGTAPLNKALAVIGTDLDTLRLKLKVPVADGGGLVNVMRDIKVAAEASGVQLAALTGRVEAAKIIESLAGSQDKYNASLSTFNSVLGEVDANAAEQAFQVAATSIAAQTDGIMATVQGYFNSVFQEIGSGATTTLSALTQLSPAITGVAGVTSLFGSSFAGLGSSMLKFGVESSNTARSLLTKMIPALGATATANGVANVSTNILSSGWQRMWASALGPIGLIVAGLAIVGTGLYFLIDALVDSTEEKLENAKADEEIIANQKLVNESEQKSIQSKQALIAQYEKLSSKANLTAEEQQKLNETVAQLNGIYPDAISSTKSLEENLKSLGDASAENVSKLSDLQSEMQKLESEAKKATIKRVELEVDFNAETLTTGLVDEIDNFTGLDVFSGDKVNLVEGLVKNITDAGSSGDVQTALVGFQSALWNNEAFKDMTPEAKKEFIENAKKLAESRNAEIEEKNKQATENLNNTLSSLAVKGVTILSDEDVNKLAETSGKTTDVVRQMMDTAVKEVRDKNLGEVISESSKVNNKLKATESLDELLLAYKNAGDEVQKSAIGEKIQQIAPEAVNATGVIKNANGELINTYDVLEDKVQAAADKQKEIYSSDLADKQGQYLASLDVETDKYEANSKELDKLQAQISKDRKLGLDTTAAENSYKKLNAENQAIEKDIFKMSAEWSKAGLSTEEVFKKVADATGKPITEVSKLVTEIENSTKAVEETEDAVKSLGEQFSEGLESAKAGFSNNIPELAALYKQLKEAQSSGDKEAIKNAKAQYDTQLQITKEAHSELKTYEDSEKAVKGIFETKKSTAKIESQFEKASKLYKIEKQSIENNQELFAIEQDHNIALEDRKRIAEDDLILSQKKLETLKAEKQALFDVYKITENESGELSFGLKIKPEEKEQLKQDLLSLNNSISKEETNKIKLNATVELRDDELSNKVKEQERKQLEYLIEIGVKPKLDLVIALDDDLRDIANEIEDKSSRFEDLQNIEIKGTITSVQKAEYLKLEEELQKLYNKERDLKKNSTQLKVAIYDNELSLLKDKHSDELTEIENRLDQEARLKDVILTTTSNIANDDIDKEFEGRTIKLESLKDAELISEENFNKQKQDLELEHQKKLQVIQEMSLGSQLEAERQADLTKLGKKKKQLVDELAIEQEKAKATGDTKRFNELNESIALIESQIADKGDIITSLAGNLQGNITEIFSSLTGNEEQMKEPWRKAFSIIAGALKELASTAITNMILGQLNITAGATGLTGLLLIPAIKGLANAGVSAILNPILSGLLSFSTGGRVDEPTLAWVGDASNSRPGADTEWILRDDQLKYLMRKVASEYHKELLEVFSSRKEIDIKELNKEILNSYTYVFSKAIEENSKELSKEKINEYNQTSIQLLIVEKMKENDVNIVRLFSDVANETKTIQKELKFNTITQNKYNEEFKRVLESNFENEIRNDYFVENLSKVTSEIQTMKVLFKENQFNTENINDFVKNYNKVITTQKEYMTDKISSVDYREVIHQSVINVKSYANGSPFLTSPELAIIGDAGLNNPEIVLNLEQLQDIMHSTSRMTIEALSKKFDEVVEASYQIVDAVNNSGLTDESISKALNRIKESERKRSRTF